MSSTKTRRDGHCPLEAGPQVADTGRRHFSLESLKETPKRTPEQIREAIRSGRVAEMTPHQAGL